MSKFSSLRIAIAGIVGALYVALSLVTFPVASGAIQFRISEGLCLLPLIFPESILGLCVGCAISNFVTGCALYDIIFGSVITLVAGILTYLTGKFMKNLALKIIVGGIFPVLLNAFFLPLIWYFCYGKLEYVYWLQVLFLIISQSVSVYAIGSLIVLGLNKRNKLFSKK